MLERVAQRDQPTRPTFTQADSSSDIATLAKKCWADPPLDRPPFHEIKKLIKIAKLKR